MSTSVKTKTKDLINKPFIHILTIISVVLLIYFNTFNAPFQFDDTANIVENPAIKDFHYFSDTSRVEHINSSNGLNKNIFKTRVIGYLTFALNYRLHGLDVRGYHLVNILIHTLNSLLLYWFVTLTFRTPFFSAAGKQLAFPYGALNFIALFTALFFAVHPIQTQAVTYIVQRFTSLATLFYLLSLAMYVKWKEDKEHQVKRYVPSAMLYVFSFLPAVLAMKTKELAFTLPIVMTLYELMFFNGKITKRLLYLSPFFLATILIPLSLAGTEGPLADISGIDEEAVNMSGATGSISRVDYLYTQFRVIVTYMRLLFFPINQNIDYDYPIFRSFFNPVVVLSFLFLLSVIIAGIYLYRVSKKSEAKYGFWHRLISFGILWFFITLSAESGVIPIRDVIFEHRVYLPSVGFFIALTAAIGAGTERRKKFAPCFEKTSFFAMVLLVSALSAFTYARNSLWNDSVSLWEDVVKKSPGKARPHGNLGLAYFNRGRTNEAINEYQTALKLDPYYIIHNKLGLAYAKQGRFNEAINEFKTDLKIKPYHTTHYNLGVAYAKQGHINEAISEFKTALKIKPDYAQAHQALGLLLKTGHF